MYCGNNRLDRRLLEGSLILGNRYGCLKQGIGKGLELSPYTEPYSPIYRETIYCGTKNRLPAGYSRFGSNVDCFRKGVGIGKGKATLQHKPYWLVLLILSLLLIVLIVGGYYLAQPTLL